MIRKGDANGVLWWWNPNFGGGDYVIGYISRILGMSHWALGLGSFLWRPRLKAQLVYNSGLYLIWANSNLRLNADLAHWQIFKCFLVFLWGSNCYYVSVHGNDKPLQIWHILEIWSNYTCAYGTTCIHTSQFKSHS